MTNEEWALVGVGVGAVLGGVAQILNSWLQAFLGRRSALRAERRDAYVEFLTILESVALNLERHQESGWSESPELASEVKEQLWRLAARISLLAPRSTSMAAERLYEALEDLDADALLDKGHRSLVGRFLFRARRDMGNSVIAL
jgi:hypothetical protein